MSSSPDVRWRWRLALATALLALAWGAPRLGGVLAAAGATAVSLSAGIAALAVLLLARQQLGLWSDGPRAGAPEPLRGLAVGCVLATTLLADGNVARARGLWAGDWSAVAALLAGTAAWGAVIARGGQATLWRWYALAAAVALVPVTATIVVLRPAIAVGPFLGAMLFFAAVDAAVLLVTEELAFRRALVGRPSAAGLGSIAFAAVVFGLWHVVQPGYGGSPLWSFVGISLGGFITGCLYVLSDSLTVAAAYHALHNAPLKALDGAVVAAGQGRIASTLGLTLSATLALSLGWLVGRRGGAARASLS